MTELGEARGNSGGGPQRYWRANRSSDLGRGGCFVEPSHGIESSNWAIFGKKKWRCLMKRKQGYGAQLGANLEPTKGVGRLRQQGGGHGSRNPLRIDPKSRKPSDSAYREPKGSVKIRNRGVAVGGSVRESGGGPAAGRAPPRRVVSVHSRALENPEDRVRSRPVVLITHQVSKVNSLWSMEQFPNPSTVGGLLEPLTWRERTASCRPGDGLGPALSGAFPASNSQLRTDALNVKVKKFNQARVNGGSNYDSLKRNHSQGGGLGRISGKEDPVELDSMRIRTVKAWPIDPLDLEFEARGVRKVTTGITGLWQPSVHSGVAFDPSMERELGLDRRETESGLEATHAPAADCRPSVGAGSQRRVSLAKSVPLMCTSLGQKHPGGSINSERAFVHSCVHGYHGSWLDIIHPFNAQPRSDHEKIRKMITLGWMISHYCGKDLSSQHHCPLTVHGKNQRADMCTNGQSSWRKSPKQSTLTVHQYTVVYWRTVLVAKITEQSTGRASVPICVLMYCPRGEKHRTVHGKGQRADILTGGQSSW
ncbi:hypothetical protein Bca101_101783 [Brassica carinata]